MPSNAFWLIFISVPILVGWTLRWLAKCDARPSDKGVVSYGARPKVFVLAVTGAAFGLVAFVATRLRGPRDVEELPYLIFIFAGLCGALLLEFFGVRMVFDETGVRLSSPWSRRRSIRWADLRSARWRHITKYLDLDDGANVVHLSVMLAGLDAFAEECVARSPARALSDREAAAVLQLMRMGKAGALTFSEKQPSRFLSDITE